MPWVRSFQVEGSGRTLSRYACERSNDSPAWDGAYDSEGEQVDRKRTLGDRRGPPGKRAPVEGRRRTTP